MAAVAGCAALMDGTTLLPKSNKGTGKVGAGMRQSGGAEATVVTVIPSAD